MLMQGSPVKQLLEGRNIARVHSVQELLEDAMQAVVDLSSTQTRICVSKFSIHRDSRVHKALLLRHL
jgi:hypothetical protein